MANNQGLMRLWCNWNSHTLLVDEHISVIILENFQTVSTKVKHMHKLCPTAPDKVVENAN